MSSNVDVNVRPDPDSELVKIADYVVGHEISSKEAMETAKNCLMDTLGCGFLAQKFPECAKHLGPLVPGTVVPLGARVPGTQFELDPVKAAWDIGCMIRWLDFNDTWLAAEWGHPSDNLGSILAVADYLSRNNVAQGRSPLTMKDVLVGMIKAHEIQGCLALENSFNRVGLDHVLLVRVASTAVVTQMLGGSHDQVIDALSHAWLDGSSLRTYRHAPNAGPRKSWAAGDATSRAVRLAMLVLKGEIGYPSALSAPTWGFYDVSFKGEAFKFQRDYGSYVMENVLFKISFPAEFHAQTAVEAAVSLHQEAMSRFDDIEKIVITTHESAIRIISKTGQLNNPADRDHCLQIEENQRFSQEYHEPDKRSIANAIQIFYKDGTTSDQVTVEYPIGHRRRREEGIPILEDKFARNLAVRFPQGRVNEIFEMCVDLDRLIETPVNEFMDKLVI